MGGERQVLYVDRGAMQRRWSRVIVVCSHLLNSLAPCFQFTNLTDLESLAIAGNENSLGMTCDDCLPGDVFTR